MLKLNDSNVTIMAKDMNKSIDFYKSIGLTLKNRWGDHYAMLSGGGLTLGIHPGGDGKIGSGNVSIGFMIDKAEEGKALLDKQGINYTQEADGKSGVYLHFKDPDGTVIYFVEPKW